MWTAAALASAGGGAVGFLVWQVISRWQRRAVGRRLSSRLRDIAQSTPSSQRSQPLRDARYSHLPLLGHLIVRWSIAPRVLLFLEQAGSTMNVSSYLSLQLCCALVAMLIASWLRVPFWLACTLTAAAGAAPWAIMAAKRQRRLTRLAEQLPDAIRMIASALRAGLGFDAGIGLVAGELPDPIRVEFRKLLNESLIEADAAQAFSRLGRRVPIPSFKLFAAAARLHRDVGGNFAETLDQLETAVRDRFRLLRELNTLTAESRLTGWVLGTLPLVVGVGLMLLSPGYLRPLLSSASGHTLLWAAAGLQVAGFGIIWWLVHPRIE